MIAKKIVIDRHVSRYLKFFDRATRLSPPGSVSRQFLVEAKIRFRQFKRSGDPSMRFLTWMALHRVAVALQKETAL